MTFKNKYVKTKLSESYTHIIATTAFVKTQAFRSECVGLFLGYFTAGHCILLPKMGS